MDRIIPLLKRTHQAYAQGQYMELLGFGYFEYVCSVSRTLWLKGITDKAEIHQPLQAVFREHLPLDDEIFLYACKDSMVVTSIRVFLLNSAGLIRPPIELQDIEQCDSSGWLHKKKLELTLTDGTVIEHEGPEVVADDVIMQLAKAVTDEAHRSTLHIEPLPDVEQDITLHAESEHEWAIEKMRALASTLTAPEEIEACGLVSWESGESNFKHGVVLWAGRAVLGIVGDLFFGGKYDAFGIAALTKDRLYLGKVGEIAQEEFVSEHDLSNLDSIEAVLDLPISQVVTGGYGRILTLVRPDENDLDLICKLGVIGNNHTLPAHVVRLRDVDQAVS